MVLKSCCSQPLRLKRDDICGAFFFFFFSDYHSISIRKVSLHLAWSSLTANPMSLSKVNMKLLGTTSAIFGSLFFFPSLASTTINWISSSSSSHWPFVLPQAERRQIESGPVDDGYNTAQNRTFWPAKRVANRNETISDGEVIGNKSKERNRPFPKEDLVAANRQTDEQTDRQT